MTMNTLKKIGTISALMAALTGCLKNQGSSIESKIQQEEIVPTERTLKTRYEEIKIYKDGDGNEVWETEPLSSSFYLEPSRTTYKDESIEVLKYDSGQTWVYSKDGISMKDKFGNVYNLERRK